MAGELLTTPVPQGLPSTLLLMEELHGEGLHSVWLGLEHKMQPQNSSVCQNRAMLSVGNG